MKPILLERKNIIRIAVVTALVLLIPVIGMQVSDEWNWTLSDFVFATVLLFGTGLAYEVISKQGDTVAYRAAVGLAALTAFLLVWVNAAVGIIGDENPANILYLGVLVVGFLGALMSRLESRGMARALFMTAFAQFLVPVIGLIFWSPQAFSWEPGVLRVFILNTAFVAFWVGSGILFRNSSLTNSK